MKELLFATGNPSKVERFYDKLIKRNIKLISLNDIECKDIEINENGKNATENALIKVRAYSKIINDMPIMAMDDTLYLENVPEDKQPGTYVRRVNGKRLSDEEMIEYYSNLAKEYGIEGKITCRWVYSIAIIDENGKESIFNWNKEDFYMVDKVDSKRDIGYPLNSISINKKLNKYFTDMTEEDKLNVKEDETDVVDFIASRVLDFSNER